MIVGIAAGIFVTSPYKLPRRRDFDLMATVVKQLVQYLPKAVAGTVVLGYFGIIKPLQFYVRLAVYILAVAFCAFNGAVLSAVLTLIGKQGLSQWCVARMFLYIAGTILGIKVVIKNPERLKTRPAVFISNHQSELDILILGATFPQYCSVTAKKSLKYYPFLGWFMALSGSVFIDRANRDNALKAFEGAAKKVNRDKQSVFMFPEGTRSYYQEPGLLPFKKGAFHFAVQAGVPIVPFVVSNYSKVVNFKKRIFEPGVIEIEVLEPIKVTGKETKEEINQLVEGTRERMLESTQRLGYGSEYNKKSN